MSLPPLEAAYTFFTFISGPFRFHDDVQLDVPTITQSNEMIIMEGIMRQDAWAKIQDHVPSLNMVPRLVPNPASTGSEINLEADEWRVLTMVNGKNTVAQIAQRSSLGEMRTCEIIAQLLASGLLVEFELPGVQAVDQQHVGALQVGEKGGGSGHAGYPWRRGSQMILQARRGKVRLACRPPPSRLTRRMLPAWRRAMLCTMARPSPAPWPLPRL